MLRSFVFDYLCAFGFCEEALFSGGDEQEVSERLRSDLVAFVKKSVLRPENALNKILI